MINECSFNDTVLEKYINIVAKKRIINNDRFEYVQHKYYGIPNCFIVLKDKILYSK